MAQAGLRVLVVDDQSPDGTGEVADELARVFAGRVEVLHRVGRRGLGRAYIEAFRYRWPRARRMSSARWTPTSLTIRPTCRR